ncbi:MAG: serine hydrolase [Gemmatimonadota bacterium]
MRALIVRNIAASILLALGGWEFLVAPTGLKAQPDTTRLGQTLHTLCVTQHVPGASAALILADESLWTGTCGIAAQDSTPVRPDHVFEIGSITKTYTAALILDLVSDGSIGLDDPVAPLLPEIPHLDGVTLRNLLQQTSGLFDFTDHPSYLPALRSDFGRTWNAPELLERFGGPPVSAPGERWDYSNTNYHVLGLIAEKVTGQDVDHALHERVLDPPGLRHTFFAAADSVTASAAHAFLDINGDGQPEDLTALVSNTSFLTAAWTSGAIMATAADAARWLRSFAKGEFLKGSLYGELTSWRERGDGMEYGLGLIRDPRGAMDLVGHEGNSAGFSASAWHAMDEDVTVVVLTNKHAANVTPIAVTLLETVLGGVTAELHLAVAEGGGAGVVDAYRRLKQQYPPDHFYENLLNALGYELLNAGRVSDAVAVLELNVTEYPDSANPYDSLGDAYTAAGRLLEARDNYARAVELAEAGDHPNLPVYRTNLEQARKALSGQ